MSILRTWYETFVCHHSGFCFSAHFGDRTTMAMAPANIRIHASQKRANSTVLKWKLSFFTGFSRYSAGKMTKNRENHEKSAIFKILMENSPNRLPERIISVFFELLFRQTDSLGFQLEIDNFCVLELSKRWVLKIFDGKLGVSVYFW